MMKLDVDPGALTPAMLSPSFQLHKQPSSKKMA